MRIMGKQKNLFHQPFQISQESRVQTKGHKSLVIWFTGLSGSGKSSLANALEVLLIEKGFHTYILDGDNVRKGLNSDLTFTPEDRKENIRRIGEVANLMIDAGLIVLSAFVSPYRADRQRVKQIVGKNNFIEVYVNTSIEECERRDVKGLYAKARNGEILDFTGISAPYEVPLQPDVKIDTTKESITQSIQTIFEALENKIRQ